MTAPVIKRATHNIDAADQVLGRLATKVALLLRGKGKVGFTLNQDLGDVVIIHNVEKMKITGRKLEQKTYYRHSGYPGGLHEKKLAQVIVERPDRVLISAVKNMLPKNRLQNNWLKRLKFEKENNA